MRLEERFDHEQSAKGLSFTDATNATAVHGYKAASCHSAYIVISRNLDALNNFVRPKDQNVYRALLRLFRLTALVQIKDDLADWFGVLTPELVDGVLDHAHDLMDEIRPDAVALVDAFGYDAVFQAPPPA